MSEGESATPSGVARGLVSVLPAASGMVAAGAALEEVSSFISRLRGASN